MDGLKKQTNKKPQTFNAALPLTGKLHSHTQVNVNIFQLSRSCLLL